MHIAEPMPCATLKPYRGPTTMRDCPIRAWSSAAIIGVIVLLAGCAKTPVSGTFVARTVSEIDMIHVVEAPPGHLTGSMVTTTLKQDGATKTRNYSVSGSIDRSNVSLRLGGGLVGLVRLFGTDTVLVGRLRGSTLTLSVGNSTTVFHEVSKATYRKDLARLNVIGGHIALVQKSTKALRYAIQAGHRISARLQQYMTWGETRISRVPYIRSWYANQVRHYRTCLNYIKPLASANVPVWRWQECAIGIATNKYDRDRAIANLRSLQNQNRQMVRRLDMEIHDASVQFARMTKMVSSSCRYRGADSGKCQAAVKKLQTMMPYGFINKAALSGFQGLVPKVKGALDDDIRIGSAGEARLSDLAQEVSRIYRAATAR